MTTKFEKDKVIMDVLTYNRLIHESSLYFRLKPEVDYLLLALKNHDQFKETLNNIRRIMVTEY
jgi:hypothetical protein